MCSFPKRCNSTSMITFSQCAIILLSFSAGLANGYCGFLSGSWVEEPISAHCYLFVSSPKTFKDAKTHCSEINSQLVQIDTSAEWDFIKANVLTGSSDVWLPLCNSLPGVSSWCWDDGSIGPLFYDWTNTDPNDYDDGYERVCSRLVQTQDWRWGDYRVWETDDLPFVCERPIHFEISSIGISGASFQRIGKEQIYSCSDQQVLRFRHGLGSAACASECSTKTTCQCFAFNLIELPDGAGSECHLLPYTTCSLVTQTSGLVYVRN